ncbi:MAG: nuclear transport factor 2 family protein [Sphingomonas sp.]
MTRIVSRGAGVLGVVGAALLLTNAASAADQERAVPADLAAKLSIGRTAHLSGNAELLVSAFADDFTSVDKGRVANPSRNDSLARFRAYFAAVSFRAWDDLAPPVVTLSDDATLATVLVRKRVSVVPKAQAGNPNAKVSETRFAWLEIWRKRGGEWRLTAVVSTNEPVAA